MTVEKGARSVAAAARAGRALRSGDRVREPAAVRRLDDAAAGHAVLAVRAVPPEDAAIRRDREFPDLRAARRLRLVDVAPCDAARRNAARARHRGRRLVRAGDDAVVPAAALRERPATSRRTASARSSGGIARRRVHPLAAARRTAPRAPAHHPPGHDGRRRPGPARHVARRADQSGDSAVRAHVRSRAAASAPPPRAAARPMSPP